MSGRGTGPEDPRTPRQNGRSMQVTETVADGLKREFKVVIPAQSFQERIETRLKDRQRSMRLPGFRPGKVPMALVAKHWRQHVTGEELQSTIGDSSAQIVSERGLRPAGQPKIEITNFTDGSDLEYKMALELLPEIEPMDMAQLELTRTVVDIPEAEVEQALQRIATDQAKSEPMAEPRPAAQGDVVVADFVGRIDGEEFEAGKAAVFEVDVKELRQLQPAAIDDELAKSLGLDNVEALRQRVREQLEGEYASASRTRLKRQLLDKLAESHSFEMPPGMVDSEFEQI